MVGRTARWPRRGSKGFVRQTRMVRAPIGASGAAWALRCIRVEPFCGQLVWGRPTGARVDSRLSQRSDGAGVDGS